MMALGVLQLLILLQESLSFLLLLLLLLLLLPLRQVLLPVCLLQRQGRHPH